MKTLTILLPAMLAAQGVFAQLPESHPLFERDEVHEMHVRFEQPDWYQRLLSNFNGTQEDVPFTEASFEWRDVKFEKVGVRIKGNSTARVNSVKKPFRIKFNEYVKGQKIKGIGSINLNNMSMDPSMAREKPYFELAAKAGLKAPRMNYAALYINNEYHGLYFLSEVINDDYIDDHFVKAEKDGWLYKGDLGSAFDDRGDSKDAYKRTFEKKTFEDEDDWSDLIGLHSILHKTPAEDLMAKIEAVFDLNSFLTAMALDNITVNLDSYVGMAQNYYLYRRPTDNRFEWLVWDPSLAFGSFNAGLNADQMRTMPLEWTSANAPAGGPGGGLPPGGPGPGLPPGGPGGAGGFGGTTRPLATKLWEIPEIKVRYTAIYRRLVDEVYRPDEIIGRMNQLRDLIRPWVERDKNKLVTMQQFEAAMTQTATAPAPGGPGGGAGGGVAIEPLVRGRLDAVKQLLAERP